MKILFLSRWFPFPPDNGSKIRIYNLLRYLSEENEVDLVAFSIKDVTDKRLQSAKRYCKNVKTIRYDAFNPRHWKAILGFFSRKPRSMVQTFNLKMQQCIENQIEQNDYELVLASQLDMLLYTEKIKGTEKILEELELTPFIEQTTREKSILGRFRRKMAWMKLTNYVKTATEDFSGITVVSKKEKKLVESILLQEERVCVIPNTVDVEGNAAYSDTQKTNYPSLIFNGALSFYVNYDAMKYFLCDIFPGIQKTIPEVKLFITGSLSGVDLSDFPKNDGVVFTGYLEDIQKAVAQSWVCVVPIRLGGGTRLKILEALSLGTPVVSTSKGAEGLELVSGQDYLVGDTTVDFANQVVWLLQDEKTRTELSEAGYASVKEKYDWRSGGARLEKFISKVTDSNVTF